MGRVLIAFSLGPTGPRHLGQKPRFSQSGLTIPERDKLQMKIQSRRSVSSSRTQAEQIAQRVRSMDGLGDARREQYPTLILLAAAPGLRSSEALALRINDIDFKASIVRVDESSDQRTNGRIGPCKNAAAYRTLALHDLEGKKSMRRLKHLLMSSPNAEALIFRFKRGGSILETTILNQGQHLKHWVLPQGGFARVLPFARDAMLHTLGTYLHLPRIWYTVPEGIMQKSKAEKLRTLASKRQIVGTKDARELGIPRTYLPRLARRGDLEKIGRGLYSSRDFAGTENTSLIEAAYQIPKGIVCLLSALRFHDFTTQSPHEVWMTIGHKAWAPKVSSPLVRIVRMSGPALHFGMKEYSISGATLRVFSPAKTVADCFKFRSKIGLDVAIEALKECRRRKKASMDELAAAAKVCRVANVMRPYLESL